MSAVIVPEPGQYPRDGSAFFSLEEFKVHPAAQQLPLMAVGPLQVNMALYGQSNAMTLYWPNINEPAWLIDGRRRTLALNRINADKSRADKIIPRYVILTGDDLRGLTPELWVLVEHLARRDLTASQRAMIATQHWDRTAEQARERMLFGKPPETLPDGQVTEKGDTRDILGKLVGVSGKLLDYARQVRESEHEPLITAAIRGSVAVKDAAVVARQIIEKRVTREQVVEALEDESASARDTRRKLTLLIKEKQRRDAAGKEVPDDLVGVWEHTEALLRQFRSIDYSLRALGESDEIELRGVTREILAKALQQLKSKFEKALPYVVCQCAYEGNWCEACNGTGWLTKVEHDKQLKGTQAVRGAKKPRGRRRQTRSTSSNGGPEADTGAELASDSVSTNYVEMMESGPR